MYYYLAPYVGTGTKRDPYRPRTDQQWSAIDLRPTSRYRDGGGLNACLLAVPEREPGLFLLGQDPQDTLGRRLQRTLTHKLGLVDLLAKRFFQAARDLLMEPPTNAWKRLMPTDERYEIWLGLLWSMPLMRGGIRIIRADDDFERANGALGGNWVANGSSDIQIVSNHIEAASVGGGGIVLWSVASYTADQFGQVRHLVWGPPANDFSNGGATLRAETPTSDTHYQIQAIRTDAGANQMNMVKVVSAGLTTLNNPTFIWAANHYVRGEIQGSTLKGYGGTSIQVPSPYAFLTDTEIDGTIVGGKRFGVVVEANTTVTDIQVDEFDGGDISYGVRCTPGKFTF